ncbi:hypothetical protein D9M71_190360 [compost metagenome]
MKASLPARQKGAAAIEFAVVFLVFFAVFYGIVTYSLPLLLMQSFNQASAEAVRRCVALDPAVDGYGTKVNDLAELVLGQQLAWIPPRLGFVVADDSTVSLNGKLLTVTIHYPKAKLDQAIPFLVLPGIGQVPRLPDTLRAQASLQL